MTRPLPSTPLGSPPLPSLPLQIQRRGGMGAAAAAAGAGGGDDGGPWLLPSLSPPRWAANREHGHHRLTAASMHSESEVARMSLDLPLLKILKWDTLWNLM
uniref:Uncharacterized protein n=1 Tax=Oryza rufipogon TaxID=4529 RepID=A0A0E0NF60_ORYRU